MLSICNKITGTERYLTWTGMSWSWQPKVKNYLFGCPHPRSIEPLLKIHGYDVQPLIEKKYLRMATELGLTNANFVGRKCVVINNQNVVVFVQMELCVTIFHHIMVYVMFIDIKKLHILIHNISINDI